MELKKLALEPAHQSLGAKMIPFAGYNMPVRYSSERDEHLNVRQNVGVFDVSHMGEFLVKGPQALDLIQFVCSNDASKLYPGKVQYACLPNDKGGIVDDLLVYMLDDQEYMLVVNASNIDKDWDWINKHNNFDARLENISDQMSLIAVQGPKAVSVLQPLTAIDLEAMKYYTFKTGNIKDITSEAIISATGYTGAGGFELYVKNEDAESVWQAVFESGSSHGIMPAGLAARDTLRLEMGLCLYGNDIDETTSPIEARLGWITKFNKSFINDAGLKRQKDEGPERKLVGFVMDDKGIPRAGYDIQDENGNKIGHVTSGTMSPSMNQGIGMGYVASGFASPGNTIFIAVRKRSLKATIVKMPIYKGN